MKSLAKTQGSKVRINAIAPGLLLTEWVCIRFPRGPHKITNSVQWAGAGPDRIEALKDKAILKKEVDERCRCNVVSS